MENVLLTAEDHVKVSRQDIPKEVLDEFVFARKELEYRRAIRRLLLAISSPGYEGAPGCLDGDSLDISLLQEVITDVDTGKLAVESSRTLQALYRDARCLLRARVARSDLNWDELLVLTQPCIDALSAASATPIDDFAATTYIVHKELTLLRADMTFMICLQEFVV